jgi:hypothetical protein
MLTHRHTILGHALSILCVRVYKACACTFSAYANMFAHFIKKKERSVQ